MKAVQLEPTEANIDFEGRGLDFEVELLNERKLCNSVSGVDLEDFEDFEISTGLDEREDLDIPTHSEPEIIRHFTRLSQKNYSHYQNKENLT